MALDTETKDEELTAEQLEAIAEQQKAQDEFDVKAASVKKMQDDAQANADAADKVADVAKAEVKAKKDAAKKKQPESVVFESAYSYFDADDEHQYWSEGQTETDPAKIAELIKRSAPLKDI